MAEAKKELPKTLFVKWAGMDDEAYLEASQTEDAAVEDDGEVAEVGVYKLERIAKFRKVVEEV